MAAQAIDSTSRTKILNTDLQQIKPMSKYTPETYSVKKLQTLLEKHDALILQRGQYLQTFQALQEEEKKLLMTADLDDKKQFKQISDVRLKKELSPRRVENVNERIEDVLLEVNEECDSLISGLLEILSEKAACVISLIAGQLKGFYSHREEAAVAAAETIYGSTNFANKELALTHYLKTEGVSRALPLFKAKKVLDTSVRVTLLEVLGEEPGPIFGEVHTSEWHEDRELERLLAKAGREEFIQTKMMQASFAREEAEKRFARAH